MSNQEKLKRKVPRSIRKIERDHPDFARTIERFLSTPPERHTEQPPVRKPKADKPD